MIGPLQVTAIWIFYKGMLHDHWRNVELKKMLLKMCFAFYLIKWDTFIKGGIRFAFHLIREKLKIRLEKTLIGENDVKQYFFFFDSFEENWAVFIESMATKCVVRVVIC